MSGERPPTIAPPLVAELYAHANDGYPEEVCGLLIGPGGDGPITIDEIRRCDNRQNAFHAADPERHPRTAATAYALGREDIQFLEDSLGGARPVRVIYHSHVDVGAYFSAEDKRMAAPPGWGPLFPDVDYLVIDARKDGARGATLFRHRDGDFVPIAELGAPEPQSR